MFPTVTKFTTFINSQGQEKRTGLIRPKQLAEMLGCHRNTLRNMVARGELPKPIRIAPRITGWRIEDIEELLDERAKAAKLS